ADVYRPCAHQWQSPGRRGSFILGGPLRLRPMTVRRSLAMALVGMMAWASAAVATAYEVLDLGTIQEGASFVIRGINSAGQIAGGATLDRGQNAFLLSRSGLVRVPGLPGSDRSATLAINESGDAVGASNTGTAVHAFLRTRDGAIRDLGTLPGDS